MSSCITTTSSPVPKWQRAWTSYRAAVFDHLARARRTVVFRTRNQCRAGYATAIWCTILLLDRTAIRRGESHQCRFSASPTADAIMKAKITFKLLTCGLLAFAAWYVHRGSNPLTQPSNLWRKAANAACPKWTSSREVPRNHPERPRLPRETTAQRRPLGRRRRQASRRHDGPCWAVDAHGSERQK